MVGVLPVELADVQAHERGVRHGLEELARELFQAVANTALMGLHIRQLDGENSHHIIEGMFKAFGRALRQAVAVTGGALPSTKGVL